jgi:hypothetical protein
MTMTLKKISPLRLLALAALLVLPLSVAIGAEGDTSASADELIEKMETDVDFLRKQLDKAFKVLEDVKGQGQFERAQKIDNSIKAMKGLVRLAETSLSQCKDAAKKGNTGKCKKKANTVKVTVDKMKELMVEVRTGGVRGKITAIGEEAEVEVEAEAGEAFAEMTGPAYGRDGSPITRGRGASGGDSTFNPSSGTGSESSGETSFTDAANIPAVESAAATSGGTKPPTRPLARDDYDSPEDFEKAKEEAKKEQDKKTPAPLPTCATPPCE